MRALARRLLAVSQTASEPQLDDAAAVIERLRTAVITLAGADGFSSLLRRAVALARQEVASLKSVTIGADGRLVQATPPTAGTGAAALSARSEEVVAVAAQLLGLLDTFIGEALTLKLVGEAWPELSPDGRNSRSEKNR